MKVQLELATGADHRPSGVTIVRPRGGGRGAEPKRLNRAALATLGAREPAFDLCRGVPPFPEGRSASEMADPFVKWCRLLVAEVAPSERETPKKP